MKIYCNIYKYKNINSGGEDEKMRYTRYNYKKKKNNDILKLYLYYISIEHL